MSTRALEEPDPPAPRACPRAAAGIGTAGLARPAGPLPVLACTMMLLSTAMLAWLLTMSVVHWPTLTRLWVEASEQRRQMLSGEAAVTTWLVEHDDFAALQRAALSMDDVLGIEVYRLPHEAAIAFRTAESASIARVAALPMVTDMQRRQIAMICH